MVKVQRDAQHAKAARWNPGFLRNARHSMSLIGLPSPPRSFGFRCRTDGPRLVELKLEAEAHFFGPAGPDAQMHLGDEVVPDPAHGELFVIKLDSIKVHSAPRVAQIFAESACDLPSARRCRETEFLR